MSDQGAPERWRGLWERLTAIAPDDAAALRALAEERSQFRAMVENSSDMVVMVSADGRPSYISPAVRDVLGFEPDELIAVDPLQYIHPDDQEAIFARLGAVDTEDEIHGPALVRAQHSDGSWRWLEVLATNRLDDPDVSAIVVNVRDITVRVEAERALAAEKERYQVLVESIPDVVARFDADLQVRYLNPAADALATFGDVEWGDEQSLVASTALQQVLADGVARTYETVIRFGDRDAWFEVAVVPELGADGKVEAVMTISHDVTARKATEQNLTRQVLEDALTGLTNRAGLELALARAVRSRRKGTITVFFLDVDHFKLINDRRGHAAGDEYLREVSRRMRSTVRPHDVVARLGGDEFAVLPQGISDEGDASALARRIHAGIESLVSQEGDRTVGSVSIGIALAPAPAHDVDADELIRQADAAMYEAKRLGRNRSAIYHAGGQG